MPVFDAPPIFVPGWSPEARDKAEEKVRATVGYAAPRADLPVFDSAYIPMYRYMMQGRIGTCHEHAAIAATEDTAMANGYQPFPICRRLVGWVGMQIGYGGGNPSNGNSPTNDILAMSINGGGVGVAHEALCPYTDDEYTAGLKPPANVFADAKATRIIQPVTVSTDSDEQTFQLIGQGHAVANGINWDPRWDAQGETFIASFSRTHWGHALEECGYAKAGVLDNHAWICLRNWHGNLYAPLPPEKRALIRGYPGNMPEAVSEFWVRADVLAEARAAFQGGERVAVTDIVGMGHMFDLSGVLSHVLRR